MKILIQQLISCEALLRSVDETFWADNIQSVLNRGESSIDIYLRREILSWYGGMGSFNDLIISKYNDHLVEEKDEERLNDDLNQLRRDIYREVARG